jgi:hypothetical protein
MHAHAEVHCVSNMRRRIHACARKSALCVKHAEEDPCMRTQKCTVCQTCGGGSMHAHAEVHCVSKMRRRIHACARKSALCANSGGLNPKP